MLSLLFTQADARACASLRTKPGHHELLMAEQTAVRLLKGDQTAVSLSHTERVRAWSEVRRHDPSNLVCVVESNRRRRLLAALLLVLHRERVLGLHQAGLWNENFLRMQLHCQYGKHVNPQPAISHHANCFKN